MVVNVRRACRGRDDLVELGDEGSEERDGDEEDEDAEDLRQRRAGY